MDYLKKMFGLEGKTAVVTGGAQGIGRAVSEAFALAGANVAIFDLQTEKAAEVAELIMQSSGVRAIAVYCDVTEQEQIGHA